MKTKMAYVLIFLEVLIIFAVNVFDAKQQSKWVGYMIHVPENMKLTINKDISVSANDETILLKQNTTIEPSYIYPDSTVFFHFGETEEMLSVSWNCFVEQEQLETLKKEADQEYQAAQSKRMKNGVLVGVAQATSWLIIAGLITILLTKRKKYNILLILLVGLPLIIYSVSVFAKNLL